MNKDSKRFMHIAVESQDFQHLAARIAPSIHEFYRGTGDSGPYSGSGYNTLSETIKKDNEAAAMRIPWVLSLVGLYLKEKEGEPSSDHLEAIRRIIEEYLEVLAQEEHELWVRYKLKNGWRYPEDGKTNDDLKLHNCFIPYDQLRENDKNKDRNSVRSYPEIVDRAGYTLVAERPQSDREEPA